MIRAALTISIAAVFGALTACGPLKAPEMPTPVTAPVSQVQSVRLVEAGPDANRYMVTLLLTNPNDYALPLLDADYRVQIGDAGYRGDTAPNRTLPASGHVLVELPAVIAAGDAPESGTEYRISGSLEMDPPQQLKQVFYEFGLPRPRTSFSGSGTIESDLPAPPPAPGSSETAASSAPTAQP